MANIEPLGELVTPELDPKAGVYPVYSQHVNIAIKKLNDVIAKVNELDGAINTADTGIIDRLEVLEDAE